MTVFISLLRGINVGGQTRLKMADLKALYEALGFESVTTYIQSGNVVFEPNDEPLRLSHKIQTAIEKELGLSVEVLVRSLDEWRDLIGRNPYAQDDTRDTKHLLVTLLAETPDDPPIDEIDEFKADDEEYAIDGQAIYMYFPSGYGRTKLSNNFWEKKLKVAATTRNWNTVSRLLALAEEIAAT